MLYCSYMNILKALQGMSVRKPQFLGFVPNPQHEEDPRNLRYDEVSPLGGQEIPLSGDIERAPWTLNQGHSSSCTCHSTVAALHNQRDKTDLFFSPRYAFKKIKSSPKYASSQLTWGAYMRDSLLLKINEGICEYSLCPNTGTDNDQAFLNFTITPSMEGNALNFTGGSYIYVTDGSKTDEQKFDDIVRYMAEQGEGVKVGVTWRSSFNDARKTGIVPVVMPSGDLVGHDMFAVAWKVINGHPYIGFRNSFGATWGDKGRVWLPRGFFKIQSAMAYIAPQKPLSDEIKKPTSVPDEKNSYIEQANAVLLRRMLLKDFPLDVNLPAQEANMAARSLAGKLWLVLPKAITYGGWTVVDVRNWLWARSRNLAKNKAFDLDFTSVRPKKL